jgi:hypothetical protein
LVETVHAMRSFRVSHPAGRIFIDWIGGRRGPRRGRVSAGLPGSAGMSRDRIEARR